jgi:hypothetical protein
LSVEDNAVGYDIQSFGPGAIEPVNRLIEVKSSMRDPPQIFITRNEWEAAIRFGRSYVFHIWQYAKSRLVRD